MALAENNVKISVVAPISVTNSIVRKEVIPPKYRQEKTPNGSIIDIYAPRIFTIGSLGSRHPKIYQMMMKYRQHVVAKTLSKFVQQPDVIYGHFWHSAYAAYPYAKQNNLPLFVATGESKIYLHKFYNNGGLLPFSQYVSGVICVSTKNKNESILAGLTEVDKCQIIPNAIDNTIFCQKDKQQLRAKYGFDTDNFIIACVGLFSDRKGQKRVAAAIDKLNDSNIKSIFIGKSETNDEKDTPECDGILFRGALPHNIVADYLNCADVFVLPTLAEGCCNANIEAMACGLPIISSDRDFNYDILGDDCAILVDPMNVDEIANAILRLKNDSELCENLSYNALKRASNLEINTRAKKIIDFIKRMI
jgi:glycosyltransferase involved in cell wall biosynthesis